MSTAQVTKLKRKAADFEQKKQLDKALALYIQLVDSAGRELDDADLQIYNRVGDMLMRQSNVSEALSYYEKAVDLYAERGYLNNAIALCNKILRQSPARTTVYYKLGKISANKGFKSDARKNFLEYADRMQKSGDTDEAFRALKEFADLCPDQDDIRLLLADLLTKEQRTEEAVHQLGQLYSKLEAEGREAEARATMDRIKAINPDVAPPVSGTYISQKSSDLVYLDLDEPPDPVTRSTPRSPSPVADIPVVQVSGVGALEGLAVTFFPEEEATADGDDDAAPVDGLEVNALPPGEEVAPLPHLELVGTELTTPTEPLEGIQFERPDEDELAGDAIVTPVEGLASIGTAITNTHPSLAPLLDEPPLTGEEFGALELTVAKRESPPPAHDLALPSSLPMLDRASDEKSPSAPVTDDDAASSLEAAIADAPASQVTKTEGAEFLLTDGGAESDSEPEDPIAAQLEGLGEDDGDDEAPHEVLPFRPSPEGMRPPAISPSELAAIRMAHLSDPDAPIERATLSPEFALEEHGDRDDRLPTSALDTSTLSEGLSLRGMSGAADLSHDVPDVAEQGNAPSPSAFEDDRVELPLIDLGPHGLTGDSDFEELDDAAIDDLLSTPPSFASTEDLGSFDPAPLDLQDPVSTNEWEAQHPEVLIDGEWRDEHVGDLVSGEVHVVDTDASKTTDRPAAFDDLAAAMMYDGGAGTREGSAPPPASGPPSDMEPPGARRSTVTFGGTEAQLRRRLETDPENPTLRRQLGEALLDEGHREQGMQELELAVTAFEGQGAYGSAREVVDVILRVSPLSVHHHQKRVEYAVRANDRAQLIGAYTDLADALFRCGEPDKSRVVYSRVLDLDASNDRARFALGILSDAAVPAGRSDKATPPEPHRATSQPAGKAAAADRLVIDHELPTLAHLSASTAHADSRRSVAAAPLPVTPASPATAPADDLTDLALDEEVDAAFAEAHGSTLLTEPAPRTGASQPASGVAAHDEHEAPEAIVPPSAPQPIVPANETPEVAQAKRAAPADHNETPAPRAHTHARASKAHEAPVPAVRETFTAPPAERSPQPAGQDFVDLGDWLRASEPSRSTRMVADDVVPTGDENADFAEMLRRFKQGVAANVEEEDFDSHYDLGVAFKEMGLIDDAIAQFQKALRGDDHRVRAYEALGQCFVEQGQFQVASTLLRRALETTRADDQRLVGVLYLLGFSSESMGRHGDAVGYYQRVFAVDIEFRDVSSRLAALERKTQ